MKTNEAYAEYTGSHETEAQLRKALTKHASAISWKLLGRVVPSLVNESLFVALKGIREGTFRQEALFSTWFEAVVRNKCATWLSTHIRQSRREVSIEDVNWGELEGESLNPERNVAAREQVAQMLASVSSDERKILQLKLEGASAEDMGKELGLPPKVAQKRWERLRSRLANAVGA